LGATWHGYVRSRTSPGAGLIERSDMYIGVGTLLLVVIILLLILLL
jgi:hypothetical protein